MKYESRVKTIAKYSQSETALSQNAESAKTVASRRRLVQESDDSDYDRNKSTETPVMSADAVFESSKEDRRKALAELAWKRRQAENIEKESASDQPMDESTSRKQPKISSARKRKEAQVVNSTKNPKKSKSDPKYQILRALKRIVASSVLAKDDCTKKSCREQLKAKFDSDQIERVFREEFDKVAKYCTNAEEQDLRAMIAANAESNEDQGDDGDASSDLDIPLKPKMKAPKKVSSKTVEANKVKSRKSEEKDKHNKNKKSNLQSGKNENERLKGRMEAYTVFLERILSNALLGGDNSLTRRHCRGLLSAELGFEIPDTEIEFVNHEIDRISQECRIKSDEAVRAMAQQPTPQNLSHLFLSVAEKDIQDGDDDAKSGPGSDNESVESDDSASSDLAPKKKGKPRRAKGIFSGIVIAPCGKGFLQNEVALQRFRDLVESNGGKLQSCVTRKVQYVVVANGGFLKNNDSRVASARKHGAKLVKESFFEECVRQQSIINYADHAAVHADSQPSATKKNKTDKRAADDGDNGGEDDDLQITADLDEEDVVKEKKSRPRRSKEESEWSKDVRARFSYVKEARSRVYDAKDPVVSDATFVINKGILYNTYLTQTEFDDRDEGQTKFFAIKLVEAGGLMKGERWHVVTQWGKVGATKPGCEVHDFDDFQAAIDAFKQRFWEKTRNLWESSAFAFRTVSGKYTMEDLSDDDENFESSSDEVEVTSLLESRIRDLISRVISSKTMDRVLASLGVDTSKLDSRRLKGNVVRESYAELVSIQKILQRGDSAKRSEKDIQRLRGHTDRITMLLHLTSDDPDLRVINTVQALQEKARLVDELRSIAVLVSAKKRFLSAASSAISKQDTFYSSLRCHLSPIPRTSDQHQCITKMLLGTASGHHLESSIRSLNIFSVKRAGEDGRYAGFSMLGNKMLLWHAVRPTSLVSVLLQGMTTAPPETPAVGYPLGKGLYFYDSAADAMVAAGLSAGSAPVLILCEVALGIIHESTRPAYLRRAPHGCHSVIGKGSSSFDPALRERFPGENGPDVVMGAPLKAFGVAESSFKYNHYVVYDVGQASSSHAYHCFFATAFCCNIY